MKKFINKVICDNCLVAMKDIPDKSVDCIITDPPYGMKYQSAWRIATPQFKKIENDNNIDWFPEFIKECYRVLKDNSHIYIFCNDYNISKFRDLQEQAGFKNKRTLVWVKNNHTSGDLLGDYANKTEFINYAQKGRKLLNGGRNTNVLEFSRVSKLEHPTQKPVDLNEFLIKKSTNENDIILDPFAGSGTTGVACKNLNRNYILIEKEPEYIDIINKRLTPTI